MSDSRKNSVYEFSKQPSSASSVSFPVFRTVLLAVSVAGVIGGCSLIPHGSSLSGDRQNQTQASLQPSLSINRDIDLIRLNGEVSSTVEAAMIRLRASSIFGPEMLIDEIKINDNLPEAEWYTAVLDTLENMQDVEDFSITAENGELTLAGVVQSQQSAELVAANAASALQRQLVVSNEIDYPGRQLRVLAANSALVSESGNNDPVTSESDAATVATSTPVANTVEPDELPLDNNGNEAQSDAAMIQSEGALISAQPQSLTDQQFTAQSLPSPTVSGSIPLPATTSAVVLNKGENADVTLPLVDDGSSGPAIGQLANDSDADGVINSIDECDTRPGYPVNAQGCQALDGILKNVSFDAETDELTGTAMGSLDNVAQVLLDYPAARIAIMSYTSNSGSAWETRGQARDRARSVVGYLINKGVESSRLEAYAFGHINNSNDRIIIKEVD